MVHFAVIFASLLARICTAGAFPAVGHGLDALQAGARKSILDGILGTVATNVSDVDRRPDAHHPYIPPGPTDQRGPCPGLNTLSNHGYLPRDGIVTATQAIDMSNHVFNMGIDVATVLSTMQVAFSGNLETEIFSIGGEDPRTYSRTGTGSITAGRQWGADAHTRVECDNSPTKEDFDLNKGDAHTGIGSRFRRFVELAKKNEGQLNMTAVNQLYTQNIELSLENNPDLRLDGFLVIGNLAAYASIGALFSNGTYGYGGAANYESIAPLLGFELNDKGEFCSIPERLPDNWYRRSYPFEFAKEFLPTTTDTYSKRPFLLSVPSALKGAPTERVEGCADRARRRGRQVHAR